MALRQIFPCVTHPISTLKAPSGVTRMGGANVYAIKLATALVEN